MLKLILLPTAKYNSKRNKKVTSETKISPYSLGLLITFSKMDWWTSWSNEGLKGGSRVEPLTVSTLAVIVLSLAAHRITFRLIPMLSDLFINAGLFGFDLSKKTKYKVPESLGIVCGTVYLIAMFLFIPFPFVDYFTGETKRFAYGRVCVFIVPLA